MIATASPPAPAPDPAPARTLVSDAQGRFRLTGVASGSYVAVAFAEGFAPVASAPFVVVTIGATRVVPEVRIDLQRSAIAGGVVRDRYGRRVAGARVSLGGSRRTPTATATSGSPTHPPAPARSRPSTKPRTARCASSSRPATSA